MFRTLEICLSNNKLINTQDIIKSIPIKIHIKNELLFIMQQI